MDPKALKNTITAICNRVSRSMENLLKRSLARPTNPTGILSHLGFKQTYTPTNILIESQLPDYAYWVDKGRGPGKQPPIKNLVEWCNRHSMKGAEWALAKKIARDGTKPHPFLTPLQNMTTMLKQALPKIIVTETTNTIYTYVKDLKDIDIKI